MKCAAKLPSFNQHPLFQQGMFYSTNDHGGPKITAEHGH
jgi:hypothetical protein